MTQIMEYQYIAIGALVLSLILAGTLIWLTMRVLLIDRARKQLSLDIKDKSVDDVLINHDSEVKRISANLEELGQYVTGLANANKKNFQKIGFVRFDPFGDASGSISFVLAMLDAQNNGFVVSSLHGRDGNRTYAKEVKNGISKSQLTKEEEQAIHEAA